MDVQFIIVLLGFALVAIAGHEIAKVFQKIKFPLITGLIITGIIAGSSVLNFIQSDSIPKLNFLNDIALAIIAFSAGSELYLKELRSRLNSIKWMTIGQLVITFVLSSVVIYYMTSYIPFMAELSSGVKIIIAALFGVIFVARSPSSAIALINELRANGPFTKTTLGVTVLIDVLVIILFAICLSVAKAVINGEESGFSFLLILLIELVLSFGLGLLLGKILQIPLTLKINRHIKGVVIILLGYGVYLFSSFIKVNTEIIFNHEVVLEPLLICIIGSFFITNYSKNRIEFVELLNDISPTIYIIFFTLTGASLSLQTLVQVFWIAIALFGLRIFTLVLGGIFGAVAANDNKKYIFISWMPYVTQAGVALGLTTLVAAEFPSWGYEFQTIIIAIIIINQLIGPPLFKMAINYVGESHLKHKTPEYDGVRDAVIFGLESQSIALARSLKQHGWTPKIVSISNEVQINNNDFEVVSISDISLNSFKDIHLENADVIVCLVSDEENHKISELVYEHIGTKDIIVRYNGTRSFLEKFNELGVRVIDPSMAMINLLDHFVRSPNATSILLGLDTAQDSIDVEIRNKDIHGMTLRDLRFPTDVIVLSVQRKGSIIISHGYTRLRLGDIVTLVGTKESVENVRFKLES
ncbi:MAG: potassium transporter TrkA [Bacteroidetes bacterium]|nr:MAG: potassium transporter TrkA [Bacteroidota bacterium]TDI81707.1 MAG: potassium transporter TrkA [Bacteroidota bacterium]